MPADYPNYLHNSQLLQYYRLYARHFDLLKYIQFQVPTIPPSVFLNKLKSASQIHTYFIK